MKRVTQKFTGLLLLALAMSFTLKAQEIGDIYEGGYIFQINEDGIGLIADLEDLCVCSYSSAFSSASSANSQGYNDWFIPSADEMTAMNNNIGPNSIIGNIAGLSEGTNSNTYFVTGEWEDIDGTMYGYYFHLGCGCTQMQWQTGVGARRLRMVRSFNLYIHGCTDAQADNYSSEATFDDGSCIYSEAFTELQAILEAIIAEDGITQDDVDAAYAVGVASVEMLECEEVTTQNIPLDLPQGWSMFGYTCMESLNAVDAFSDISYNIEIVKDEWGLAYLPSYGFSAFDNLEFSEGYQIKMIEEVTDFQFCTTIAGGASQEELDAAYTEGAASVTPEDGVSQAEVDAAADAAYTEGAASVTPEDGVSQADLDALAESYAGWCASDTDNDGICDVDEVSGCMYASSCNYVSAAEFDDNSCVYAQAGYDCDGNEIQLQIGDQHAGGIVFQINADGTGLVADLQDLGQMNFYEAFDAAISATSQGYDDWYLPSIGELELMYNTIGQGGLEGNIGDFQNAYYWSSSELNNYYAWGVYFADGATYDYGKASPGRVRIIRAF